MRGRLLLPAITAALLGFALVQAPAGGQEVKGQVKIGLHKVNLEKGKLYEIKLTGPANAPLMVDTRPGMITRVFADNPANDKMYFVPNATGEQVFTVTFGYSFTAPDKDTFDYSLRFNAIDLAEKPVLTAKDKLTDADPKYKNGDKSYKSYKIQMKADKTYVIDLVKDGVRDPFLYLEDAKGVQVAADDDSGGELNARIIFVPRTDGEYTIIATTLGKETGGFNLTVRSGK